MLLRRPLLLFIASTVAAGFACHERDRTLTGPTAPDPSGTAGTTGDSLVDGGSVTVGTSGSPAQGAGGAGGELDNPFGIGPRYCDLNPGAGGGACRDSLHTSGFHTEPEHLQSNLSPQTKLRVWVATEFTPSTPLKEAVESGIELHEFGNDNALSWSGNWVTEGLEASELANRAWLAAAYDIVPAQPLTEGWYSLTIPRNARAALGASYARFSQPLLLQGGPFIELESGDLRADFRVGSLPFLSRVTIEGNIRITFSEQVEAAVPPVTISNPTYRPTCAPEGWTGSGRILTLTCNRGPGGPVRISFGEGLKTADGTPLRGPDGATSFEVELLAGYTLELEMPEPLADADAGAP